MTDLKLFNEIAKLNESWMDDYKKGDAKAVGDHYTEDAVSLAPGIKPIVGRQAIIDFWRVAMVEGSGILDIRSKEVERAGDFAIETGETMVVGDDDVVTDRYNYMVLWKRSGDSWLIHREIWNSELDK